MKKHKIKKDDKVIVIAGKDKGKTGLVTKVIRKDDKVVVAGVNMVTKHVKASRVSAGSIEKRESPIHISNVAIVCPKTAKATRVSYKMLDSGKKVRVAKKSGEVIDN